MGLALAAAGNDRWQREQRALPSSIRSLHRDIWLSDQLQLDVLPKLKARGVGTIIDLRPDGEAADQPPASAVESAAHAQQIQFAYIPVPHGGLGIENIREAVALVGQSVDDLDGAITKRISQRGSKS